MKETYGEPSTAVNNYSRLAESHPLRTVLVTLSAIRPAAARGGSRSKWSSRWTILKAGGVGSCDGGIGDEHQNPDSCDRCRGRGWHRGGRHQSFSSSVRLTIYQSSGERCSHHCRQTDQHRVLRAVDARAKDHGRAGTVWRSVVYRGELGYKDNNRG